jgi:HSP20 family molecular chaperone IbpA
MRLLRGPDVTTRTILFDSPFLLGFDHTRALIDRAAKAAAESYPPYNVAQVGEAAVRISLAVAGFGPDDLAVTLEGRQLTIQGKREPSDPDGQAFLHRGIAGRGFVRSFVLADGLEVDDARLEHGLLHVDLSRPDDVPAVRRIPITTG